MNSEVLNILQTSLFPFVTGENVVLENVYVWNNVTIDSNCKVTWAMLCDGVHLYDGVTVEPGCILSFGVSGWLAQDS